MPIEQLIKDSLLIKFEFFSFKKGADVPRVKSSSSLFHHKSKFRFSGRCESELIASQSHSISSKNLDSSLNTTENSTSFERSATLQNPSTFKRRTFISPYRPTSKRFSVHNTSSSDNEQKTNNSDSNNNNLKKIDSLNVSQTSSSSTKKVGGSSETASTNTQQTVIVKPDPVEEEIEEVKQEPSFTSTPQTISRHLFKEASAESNKPNDTTNTQIANEDENEIFYDHDEIQCPDINTTDLSKQNGKLVSNGTITGEINQKSYLKYLVVFACFGFMTYWLFFSNSSSSSFITRLTNNVFLIAHLIKFKLSGFLNTSDYSRNSLNPRWIQWPVFTNSTFDPLITWFLSKYRPN
ncbi:hypothetical protein BpHYR1_000062 [Brachionus plicatilis]|uniref:Uncharacterized protein n=1 Tax=Brachionus plicatilis TaxID=10195 RepID=A0A3M7SEJ1_BRAPC|nr:hypothetical protein BpHYR1_000062 [Brachionus plicatilis]